MASAANAPTAADVMTRDPRTCSMYSSVLEAVLIFRDADCGAVPVLDDGKPVGVLTDRDVAIALPEYADGLAALPVSELMTKGVVSVGPEESVEAVAEKFTDKAVRRLLVIDSAGQLVGIIAWSDLAPYLSPQRVGQIVSEVVQQP